MKVPWYGWPLLAATACRIGGPSADPKAYVEFPSDAADAAEEVSSGSDAASVVDSSPDSTLSIDAPSDSSTGDARGDGESDGSCARPDAGNCDPVTNTGCTFSQCDIDTTQTTPTGTCVIASPFPYDAGYQCTQVSGSVSCQPGYTCYGGTCQKVCFCNADCGSGQCCSGSAGTTGFGLCSACH